MTSPSSSEIPAQGQAQEQPGQSTEPQVTTPVVPPVAPTSATPPETPPDASALPDDLITINSKQIYQEVERLRAENEEFKKVYNTHVGNVAARKYQPELARQQREITRLTRELRRRDIATMKPEELEERFSKDAQFAKDYAELIHTDDDAVLAQEEENEQIRSIFIEAMENAANYGVKQETLNQIAQRAANGEFGGPDVHWTVSMQKLQNVLTQEIVKVSKPGTTTVETKPATPTNPGITGSGPDLTGGSRNTDWKMTVKTAADFNKLPPDEQRDILSTPEGQAAVAKLSK